MPHKLQLSEHNYSYGWSTLFSKGTHSEKCTLNFTESNKCLGKSLNVMTWHTLAWPKLASNCWLEGVLLLCKYK